MKALLITKVDSHTQLQLTERPTPRVKPGYILVKIRATSIQPSDVLNSKGSFSLTAFPIIPGRDFAGTVVDGPEQWVGRDVFGTSGIDLSFTSDGTHAEYCLVREAGIAPKPSNLSFAQAAALGVPFTTAALTLEAARAAKGDTVAVIGASGNVGSAIMQLGKLGGCKMLSVARRANADVNLREDPQLDTLLSAADGKGPDVVIDTVGDPALMRNAFDKTSEGGRYAFIAAPRSGSTEMAIDLTKAYRAEKSLIGCNSVSSRHPLKVLTQYLADMVRGFEAGQLVAPKEDELSLIGIEEAVEAYDTKGQRSIIVFDE